MTPNEFKEDVLLIAKKMGLNPKEIHLRQMKRKLASCSSNGRLTFDPTILNEPEETRLKIILHELLHLKYPNHGKMFKRLLETYLKEEIRYRREFS
ncbi:M48 family metallopeptidase [Methanothermobacter sp. KEPCO-1]|uniref:M48 metallopeptidase family protein n=1 Tax=Methanothermobacter sp. KEPCO-1 TaxID=2603820 RepID=UPI0011CACE17|nr:M48 family metallopeptidase [Methanothermobacter sp. KEPCO-1]QEF93683.1 M48 family metallopeptidase [Methanothermobacter sp. KEPCO-1]QEF95297.1 M48 family metallopeptidase [Methanothermobacter sp. KEPCO-1]